MDYPDPEEEYELMHADELELIREMEEEERDVLAPPPKTRRSLDFTTPMKNNASSIAQTPPPPPVVIGCEKKRKVEELFGDISDITDFEDPKRRRELTLESDAELIEKIKTHRLAQKQLNYVVETGNDSNTDGSISWRVPKYPFVPITLSNGERLYARLRTEQFVDQQVSNISAHSHTAGLLSIPYQTIWEQAQEYILQKTAAVQQEQEDINSDCEIISEGESDSADLWVEKYKPKSYIELLSDEGANRTLLHWLKLWDKVVFNRERKVTSKEVKNYKKDIKKVNRFQRALVNTDLDEHGCPQQKVALLCGPPGLGKTTLAHLLASHSGYNVVEVNASDDRNPETFRQRLEAATQMKAVLGAEPKPNCLVLDEIDGAPTASIDVLIKFVTGKDTKGKKGKKKGSGVLKRPVICICNDVYVPALRALRQMALIVQFPPTSSSRLAQRLMEIARKQKIRTDMGALLALAEKTNNDIRSCLTVLHFFKSQKKDVRLMDIQKSSIGQKDMQKGLFTVWQEVFQIQKRRVCNVASSNGQLQPVSDDNSPKMNFGDKTSTSSIAQIVHTVQGCGDYDRLAQGVFENYLNIASRDSHLYAASTGLDWFGLSDILSHKIQSTQNYILMPYLPYPFVKWHILFATNSWPKLSYPSAGYEARMKEQKCQQILKELMQGMTPIVRVHVNPSQILFDTLSPLLQILVPKLRPVSNQLYSAQEMQELNHVISVMIDFNINYIQERTEDGGYVFKLDPNIEELAYFPGVKPTRTLSYAGRQLIAREVELEKMRRAEKQMTANAPPPSQSTASVSTATKSFAAPSQKLIPKPVVEVQCKDFFGRVVEPTPGSTNSSKPRTDEIVKSEIWYHYKEGFSNAVRRSVKMKELFEPNIVW